MIEAPEKNVSKILCVSFTSLRLRSNIFNRPRTRVNKYIHTYICMSDRERGGCVREMKYTGTAICGIRNSK